MHPSALGEQTDTRRKFQEQAHGEGEVSDAQRIQTQAPVS